MLYLFFPYDETVVEKPEYDILLDKVKHMCELAELENTITFPTLFFSDDQSHYNKKSLEYFWIGKKKKKKNVSNDTLLYPATKTVWNFDLNKNIAKLLKTKIQGCLLLMWIVYGNGHKKFVELWRIKCKKKKKKVTF